MVTYCSGQSYTYTGLEGAGGFQPLPASRKKALQTLQIGKTKKPESTGPGNTPRVERRQQSPETTPPLNVSCAGF